MTPDELITFEREITLRFESISLVSERNPFPNIYVAIDTHSLEVWFKTFLTDSDSQNRFSLEDVKRIINSIVTINEWEIEKDVPLRCLEIYGICRLAKTELDEGHARINR